MSVWLIVEWLIRIVAVPMVGRRHGPHAAAAWVAVIFAMPFVGAIVYWYIGLDRLPRRRIRRRAGRTVHRGTRIASLAERHGASLGPKEQTMLALCTDLGDFPMITGNALTLLGSHTEVIDTLVADIDAAKHHVHLLFYIFEDDAIGHRVADAMRRAAARGVICRMLLDDTGSARFLRRYARGLWADGVEVQRALPVNPARFFLARIDLRNHRKLAVIDGRLGYAGSANVVDPSYGNTDLCWEDAMIRIEGPAVQHLQEVFAGDWLLDAEVRIEGADYYPTPVVAGDQRVQAVPSGPSDPTEIFAELILAAIHDARSTVVLTTPYFIPDVPILRAIQMAARRGVKVELVLPKRVDHRIVGAAGRAYFDDMLAAGVIIHRHPAVLHTKSLTVDDVFAVFGSGNIDVRSFQLNYELNLLLPGAAITAQVRALQAQYISESETIDPAAWAARPVWYWAPEQAAKLLSPIL
jgi:cardiolipin synthase